MIKQPLEIYLNAGHSGLQNGKYLTAPSKMFTHQQGTFHNNSTFYEGVSNRTFAYKLENALKTQGFSVIRCFDDELDISLNSICSIANKAYRTRKNGMRGLFLSLHSDAGGGKGLGCWTNPESKTSAFVAGLLSNSFSKNLGDTVKIRPNKEKGFYVVKNTVMPAVLIENLFFDNYDDALLLINEEYQNRFVDAVVEGILEYVSTFKEIQ